MFLNAAYYIWYCTFIVTRLSTYCGVLVAAAGTTGRVFVVGGGGCNCGAFTKRLFTIPHNANPNNIINIIK
jgi:hypothetical protein